MSRGKGKVKVLIKKTLTEFNINFSDLPEGSHKKVFVKCIKCDEAFARERRKLHQLHQCPTHKTRLDGVSLKWCNKCSAFLTYKCFKNNKARADGLDSWCKTCFKTTDSFKNMRTSQLLLRKTFDGWLKGYVKSKEAQCRKTGLNCDIDFQFLKTLWANQDGKCYYSNLDLEFGKRSLYGATLDRIDSADGYSQNNVVWCSSAMNNMKNQYSIEELYLFLENAQFNQVRLEYKFINKDAKIPFRKRTTDAGYDFYAIESTILPAGKLTMVRTGICISCPEGFYFTIEGRSGLYNKGIFPTRGIIDAGYTGEIKIGLYNTNLQYIIEKGDRIAQMTLHKAINADFCEINNFSPEYKTRGDAGFGSSGRK